VILVCYDGSADAKEAITRGGPLLRGQRATVLTVWNPMTEPPVIDRGATAPVSSSS
jgi:hypothetical protein